MESIDSDDYYGIEVLYSDINNNSRIFFSLTDRKNPEVLSSIIYSLKRELKTLHF